MKLTCKLAISERPARRQTMLAGGFASATQRKINASLSSSKSISGEPISLIVGASEFYYHIFFFIFFQNNLFSRKKNKKWKKLLFKEIE